MRILLIEKDKDESIIPRGHYCYTSDEEKNANKDKDDHAFYTKACPYWSTIRNGEEQSDGYCSFLEMGDDEIAGLLWDQIKECGINNDY